MTRPAIRGGYAAFTLHPGDTLVALSLQPKERTGRAWGVARAISVVRRSPKYSGGLVEWSGLLATVLWPLTFPSLALSYSSIADSHASCF